MDESMPSYTSSSPLFMCARMAGNLVPFVPHMPSRPSFPFACRSRQTSATTPVDLSESLALPTQPVVYSPVPIIRQPGGALIRCAVRLAVCSEAGRGAC